jgi:hypothetical protein
MRSGAPAPILAGMTRTRIVIGLELDRADDSLSGTITRPDGRIVEFAGWLGLVAALDALLEPDGERVLHPPLKGEPQ